MSRIRHKYRWRCEHSWRYRYGYRHELRASFTDTLAEQREHAPLHSSPLHRCSGWPGISLYTHDISVMTAWPDNCLFCLPSVDCLSVSLVLCPRSSAPQLLCSCSSCLSCLANSWWWRSCAYSRLLLFPRLTKGLRASSHAYEHKRCPCAVGF